VNSAAESAVGSHPGAEPSAADRHGPGGHSLLLVIKVLCPTVGESAADLRSPARSGAS